MNVTTNLYLFLPAFINNSLSLPFQLSTEEILKVVKGFDDAGTLAASGVTLAGQRHIYLSGTDRVIRAKLGKVGVHCVKTGQGE